MRLGQGLPFYVTRLWPDWFSRKPVRTLACLDACAGSGKNGEYAMDGACRVSYAIHDLGTGPARLQSGGGNDGRTS